MHSLISVENTPEPNTFQDIDIEAAISERTKVQHRSQLPTNPTHQPNTLYLPQYTENMNPNVFRNITNIESPRSFARLNAERLRTIASGNELACDNQLIAPKAVLANALADHIYKVTNQKPSTSRIDEILTNKIMTGNAKNEYTDQSDYSQKENQWNWNNNQVKSESQTEEIYPNDYYMFNL